MRNDEFKLFESEFRILCAGLQRTFNDAIVNAYWRALIDVPYDEVVDNIYKILKSATKNTKFPRPADLRNLAPEEPFNRTKKMDEDFSRAELRNREMWKDWYAKDRELAEVEFAISKCGRILAADHPASPQYAQALREDRFYRDRRCALLQSRCDARQ